MAEIIDRLLKNSQEEVVEKCPNARQKKVTCLAAHTGKDSFVIIAPRGLPVCSPCLCFHPGGISSAYGYVAVMKNEGNTDASGQMGVFQQPLDALLNG